MEGSGGFEDFMRNIADSSIKLRVFRFIYSSRESDTLYLVDLETDLEIDLIKP